MKKMLLILMFCLFILSGCASSGYNYWQIGNEKPDFIPDTGGGTIYLDSLNYDLYRYYNEGWDLIGNIKGTPGKDGGFSNVYINDKGLLVIDGIESNTKVNGIDGRNGEDGSDGKDGKDGKDGVTPKISVSDDGYLLINNVKSSMKIQSSSKSCEIVNDLDGNLRVSIGDEVKCGSEYFNIINVTDSKISLFAKYNLDVGYTYNENKDEIKLIETQTGLQKEYARAWIDGSYIYGFVPFTAEPYWDNGLIKGVYGTEYPGYVYDSNSIIFNYIQEYKSKLLNMGVNTDVVRLISIDDLNILGDLDNYPWFFETSYWTGIARYNDRLFTVSFDGNIETDYYDEIFYGVRPVVEISRKDLNDEIFIDLVYNAKYCTYDGKLEAGVEFQKDGYTYTYNYDYAYDENLDLSFVETNMDGWHVALSDIDSEEPIEVRACETINGKPVKSTAFMFAGSEAESIDLSYYDTSNVTNMMGMFVDSSAYNINLKNLNTSNVTDMSGMFVGSQAVVLDLSGFDTSNVEYMDGMFSDSIISNLDLTSFNTSKVTDMSGMFAGSQTLNINLTSFDTSNVKYMSSMFANSRMTTLNLSSFDTSNVEYMDGMFAGSKATTLNLSSFDTSNVTDMSSMFSSSQATTLDLSGFDTSNVTDMSSMFSSSQATTLDLSSFDTSNVKYMSSMFADSKATTLDLSSFNTSKVTDMSGMFASSKATTLDLSNFDTRNVTNMSYMFDGSAATTIDISSFDTSKVTNMNHMFFSSKVTNLDLKKFNTSNVTDMSSMFSGIQVATLDFSSFDMGKVTNMDYMFYNSSIPEINLSGLNVENVKNMAYMFSKTKSDKVNLSGLNAKNVTDMNHMFSNSNIVTLDLSNINTSNVTNMNHMFSYNMTKILDLNDLDFNNAIDLSYMFYVNSAVNIDLPMVFSSKAQNLMYMFAYAKAEYIDFYIQSNNITNTSYMFYYNEAKYIDFGCYLYNITNMNYMFANTKSEIIDLTYMYGSINPYLSWSYLFYNSSNLKKIYTNPTKFMAHYNSGIFSGCVNLVGGLGTKYSSTYTGSSYAVIDTPDSPGYFTHYAYLENDNVSIGESLKLNYLAKTARFTILNYEIHSGSEYISLDSDTGIVTGIESGNAIIKTTIRNNNYVEEVVYSKIYVD